MNRIIMNKKAFTLIEIISVIVVMGIFLLISFPIISNAILTAQLKYFASQENTLLTSGRDYFTNDRNRLPKTIGETKSVTLTTLLNEGYLKPIKDTKSNNCHFDDSYVTVTNINKGDYQYDVRLVCDEYDTIEALSEWNDWSTDRPTDSNVEVESGIFYNYQEVTTYYGEWSDWTDVVAIKDDALRPVSEVVGSETDTRTLYRYQDQQWKWYKVDTQYSDCRSSSPGAGWVFSQTGSCQPIQESTGSCSTSAPDGTYSVDYQCSDASPPSTNPVCRTSTPGAVSGGTWSKGSTCDSDSWYSCPSGYSLSGTTCSKSDSYSISSTLHTECTCSSALLWQCLGVGCTGSGVGNCNGSCSPGYSKTATWEVNNECTHSSGDACSSAGTTITCDDNWAGTCSGTLTTSATLNTTYYYTYTWSPTHTYVWKHTVSSGIYSYTGNIFATDYSSTAPTGYPNKDTTQTQLTPWTSWDINIPTSYSYRTIENKQQQRTRSVIKDWSGNKLINYVTEPELTTKLNKSLADISADPNIKLITQTMYRYRIRKL